MCSIIFGFSAFYSLIFMLLYVGLFSFSWYVSWFMQKKMREFVIPNSLAFAAKHIFLTFLSGGLTFAIWFIGALKEELLISIILYMNYFVFFLAVVWYLIIRFGLVKEVFDVYDSRVMKSAKNLIIKTRDSRKDIFTRALVSSDSIRNYKPGSSPEIDEMILAAGKEKNSRRLLRRITEIEIALSNQIIERLRRWVSQASSKDAITPGDRRTITRYEQDIEEYARSSMEYEKAVVSKLPE
jgi:hypothetical protein